MVVLLVSASGIASARRNRKTDQRRLTSNMPHPSPEGAARGPRSLPDDGIESETYKVSTGPLAPHIDGFSS